MTAALGNCCFSRFVLLPSDQDLMMVGFPLSNKSWSIAPAKRVVSTVDLKCSSPHCKDCVGFTRVETAQRKPLENVGANSTRS